NRERCGPRTPGVPGWLRPRFLAPRDPVHGAQADPVTSQVIDRQRVKLLLERERARFAEIHPRSASAYARGGVHLFAGVPMTWMRKTAGTFPLYLDRARGARVTDIDG